MGRCDGPNDGDRRSGERAVRTQSAKNLTPAYVSRTSTSRTATAIAAHPKMSNRTPPRTTKGPRHAHAMTRGREGDREAVAMVSPDRVEHRRHETSRCLTPKTDAS